MYTSVTVHKWVQQPGSCSSNSYRPLLAQTVSLSTGLWVLPSLNCCSISWKRRLKQQLRMEVIQVCIYRKSSIVHAYMYTCMPGIDNELILTHSTSWYYYCRIAASTVCVVCTRHNNIQQHCQYPRDAYDSCVVPQFLNVSTLSKTIHIMWTQLAESNQMNHIVPVFPQMNVSGIILTGNLYV